jgi:hypothetical protein
VKKLFTIFPFTVFLVLAILINRQRVLKIRINRNIQSLKLIRTANKLKLTQILTIFQKSFTLGDLHFQKMKYNDVIKEYTNCIYFEYIRPNVLEIERQIYNLSFFSLQSLLNLSHLHDLDNKTRVL